MSSHDLVLHGAAYSVYVRSVRLTLAEKGLDYRLEEVDLFGDPEARAAHRALHPFEKMPVLEHGGFRLYETGAILRYLDAVFPEPALQPDDPQARARHDQVLSILDQYAYPQAVWGVYVPLSEAEQGNAPPPDTVALARALARSETVLDELVRLTGAHPYWFADRPMLADLHALPMLTLFDATEPGRDLLAARPALVAWFEAMQARASVQDTTPRSGPRRDPA